MAAVKPRRGREGSRWYNERPSAKEFADWFKTVQIHADLSHEAYVGGIVVIQQKEKAKEVRGFNESSGAPIIVDVENLVYSPHPNVSTRVSYFHDYLSVCDLDGVVEVDRVYGQGLGLPDGFFKYTAADQTGKPVAFIGCSMRVRMFKHGTMSYADVREGPIGDHGLIYRRQIEGDVVYEGAPGTKIVPVTGRWGADENALMKAQTGALGRALGMAGMLVIPGAGIATSEDMHEALSGENTGVPTATLPAPSESPQELEERLAQLDGNAHAEYVRWLADRGIDPAKAGAAERKAAVKQLERLLDRVPA